MIISASRRTDIPAFYSDWLLNRLNAGYVLTRNPFNSAQVSKISLSADTVDCFIFCTKDPYNMLGKQYRYRSIQHLQERLCLLICKLQ